MAEGKQNSQNATFMTVAGKDTQSLPNFITI